MTTLTDIQGAHPFATETFLLLEAYRRSAVIYEADLPFHQENLDECKCIIEDLFIKYHCQSIIGLYRDSLGRDVHEILTTDEMTTLIDALRDPCHNDSKYEFIKGHPSYSRFGDVILSHMYELTAFTPDENRMDEAPILHRISNRLYLESTPQVNLEKVENLVLAGGGAKVISLVGALNALELSEKKPKLQKLAGTSGGALVGMLYVIGMKTDVIADIVKKNHFGMFALDSRLNNKVLNYFNRKFQRYPNNALHLASDNSFFSIYHSEIASRIYQKIEVKSGSYSSVKHDSMIKKLPLSELMSIEAEAKRIALEKSFTPSHDELYTTPIYSSAQMACINAIRDFEGVDLIREFLCDQLQHHLLKKFRGDPQLCGATFNDPDLCLSKNEKRLCHRLRNLTFRELHQLRIATNGEVLDFHVAMTLKNGFGFEYADASASSAEFSDLAIADAVRVSMNLPFAYSNYEFSVNNKTYRGVDGGVKSNLSMKVFDPTLKNSLAPSMADMLDQNKTMGIFYLTGEEIADADHFSKIHSLKTMSNKQLSVLIQRTDELIQYNNFMLSYFALENPVNYSALNKALELYRIEMLHASLMLEKKNRDSRPFFERFTFKNIVNNFMDKNSIELAFSPYDVRRLIMVNTGWVDTMTFKMEPNAKHQQFMQGQSAVRRFLSNNGAYTLENEFYRQKLVENLVGMNVLNDLENELSLPVTSASPAAPLKDEFILKRRTGSK